MPRTTREMLECALASVQALSKRRYHLSGYMPGRERLYQLQVLSPGDGGGWSEVSHYLNAGDMYSLLRGLYHYIQAEKEASG